LRLILDDEDATVRLGRRLGAALRAAGPPSLVMFLEGELGAGKTTLARGFLAALGHEGRVPSPTYTLIEPYEVGGYRVLHVDLYRIRTAAEVEDLGLLDQLGAGAVALIEWPERGGRYLPEPDIRLRLEQRPPGRSLDCVAETPAGREVLDRMADMGAKTPT
jgi:tRNA threonylcarbamoyladenosine biosynthesis protein TsaE